MPWIQISKLPTPPPLRSNNIPLLKGKIQFFGMKLLLPVESFASQMAPYTIVCGDRWKDGGHYTLAILFHKMVGQIVLDQTYFCYKNFWDSTVYTRGTEQDLVWVWILPFSPSRTNWNFSWRPYIWVLKVSLPPTPQLKLLMENFDFRHIEPHFWQWRIQAPILLFSIRHCLCCLIFLLPVSKKESHWLSQQDCKFGPGFSLSQPQPDSASASPCAWISYLKWFHICFSCAVSLIKPIINTFTGNLAGYCFIQEICT